MERDLGRRTGFTEKEREFSQYTILKQMQNEAENAEEEARRKNGGAAMMRSSIDAFPDEGNLKFILSI